MLQVKLPSDQSIPGHEEARNAVLSVSKHSEGTWPAHKSVNLIPPGAESRVDGRLQRPKAAAAQRQPLANCRHSDYCLCVFKLWSCCLFGHLMLPDLAHLLMLLPRLPRQSRCGGCCCGVVAASGSFHFHSGAVAAVNLVASHDILSDTDTRTAMASVASATTPTAIAIIATVSTTLMMARLVARHYHCRLVR